VVEKQDAGVEDEGFGGGFGVACACCLRRVGCGGRRVGGHLQ